MTLIEELMAQGYPAPNIRPVSEEEDELLMDRVDELAKTEDFAGLTAMVQEVALPASTLDDLKSFYGLAYLLQGRFNLYEAVKTYGSAWLEK